MVQPLRFHVVEASPLSIGKRPYNTNGDHPFQDEKGRKPKKID
jgi:hypothetical protein